MTAEISGTANANMLTGDTRIVCTDAQILAGRLSIANLVRIDELDEMVPNLRERYVNARMEETGAPLALVPDPRTYRPCTLEEYAYYTTVVALEDIKDAGGDTNNLLFFPGPVNELQDSVVAHHVPDELTTSRNRETGLLEGVHRDEGQACGRRRATVYGAPRGVLLGTRSPSELGLRKVRELRELAPRDIGMILRLTLMPGDRYYAWTGAIIHDGTTLLDDAPYAIEKVKKCGWDIDKVTDTHEISTIGFSPVRYKRI